MKNRKHDKWQGEDEFLQIQVPASTKKHLHLRSIEDRESLRMIVLRALDAYGVPVPEAAICDRRKGGK